MMNRWLRILRHRLLDERDVHRALGAEGLARVQARVTASERRHTGEIRVCLEAGLPLSYLWRGASPRERALTMFGKLRVWDTEANNGVLIYVLLAEHAIEIIADRGLARQVQTPEWHAVIGRMREAFRAGRFEEGLNEAIDAVDTLLAARFPLASADPATGRAAPADANELPDAPDVR